MADATVSLDEFVARLRAIIEMTLVLLPEPDLREHFIEAFRRRMEEPDA